MVSSVSASHSRSALWKSNEALVIRLQAVARGFLLRQRLEARRRHLVAHTPAVVTIQVRAQPQNSLPLLLPAPPRLAARSDLIG